jgi:hypothetical protein
METEAVLIIFGETLWLEDAIGVRGDQAVERIPRVPCSHAAGGKKAAEKLADWQILGLVLGEIVAVDAMD